MATIQDENGQGFPLGQQAGKGDRRHLLNSWHLIQDRTYRSSSCTLSTRQTRWEPSVFTENSLVANTHLAGYSNTQMLCASNSLSTCICPMHYYMYEILM